MIDALFPPNKVCSAMHSEESMTNFVNVYKRFHNQISCKGSDCEVAYFIDSTLDFLMEDHSLDKKRGFFLRHVICKRFHEQIGCGTDYEVTYFINTFSAILREEHSLEEKIEFFIKKCLEQKTLLKNLNILSQRGEIVLKNY